MIRKRRNAYLAALFMLVGVAFLVVGTLVPVINLSSIVGLEFDHASVDLSSDVEFSSLLPVALGFGFVVLFFAALLALTRRQGLGILWRALALAALVVPGAVTAVFWYYVANPDEIAASGDFSVKDRVLGAGAAFGIGDASPGIGLWLLTLGCLIVVIGCFVPARKSKRLIIDENDPGFQQYNPYMDQFQRYQAQRQQPPPTYQEPPGYAQQPMADPYGQPRYYG
jgi:hypothetical protein